VRYTKRYLRQIYKIGHTRRYLRSTGRLYWTRGALQSSVPDFKALIHFDAIENTSVFSSSCGLEPLGWQHCSTGFVQQMLRQPLPLPVSQVRRIWVRVYVSVHVCVCMCTCMCARVCLCMYVFLCMWVCMLCECYAHVSRYPLPPPLILSSN